MTAAASLAPGTLFAGDYRVERHLAAGGMGAVYVVLQASTGKRRAMKVMHPTLAPDAKSRARFVEEARVGARIPSDHVVEVLAAGVEPNGVPWLVMELLDGTDLEGLVKQRGALPAADVLELMQQAAHALGAAHGLGIIHRDLKPENLFLARSQRRNESSILKVLDFGIARMVEANQTAAAATSAIGSPLWMAPEQAEAGAKLRPATDVWALGLIAFYLLTGKSYWRAANHPQFNLSAILVEVMTHAIEPPSVRASELGVALPSGFDAWFMRCVARDPMARYPDARQAVDALGPALNSAPVPVGRVAATAPLEPGRLSAGLAPTAVSQPGASSPGSWSPPPHSSSQGPPVMATQAPSSSGGSRAVLWMVLAGLAGFACLLFAGIGLLLMPRFESEPEVAAYDPAPVAPASPVAPVPLVPVPNPPSPVPDTSPQARPEPDPSPVPDTPVEPTPEPVTARRPPRPPADTPPVDTPPVDTPPAHTRPASRGRLSRAVIQRVVRRHTGEIRNCYERAGNRTEGRIHVRFTIGLTGRVESAAISQSTLPEIEQCVLSSVRRWTFPAPDGGTVAISYPFVFRPE